MEEPTLEEQEVLSTQEAVIDYGKLKFYPNPSSGRIHIELATNEIMQAVDVYSLIGKSVFLNENPSQQLDIGFLPQGIYIIEILTNNGIRRGKLIKN